MTKHISILVFLLLFSFQVLSQESDAPSKKEFWTFTYLKANEGKKELFIQFIKNNWLVLDEKAKMAELLIDYALYRNESEQDVEWDIIVAVQYYSAERYSKVREEFEKIRKPHGPQTFDGYSFKDLGSFIKTENITKEVR